MGIAACVATESQYHGLVLAGACNEAEAWNQIGSGWKPLFPAFSSKGVSFEWHDFQARSELDWGKSFHPESVEICLNISGAGSISAGSESIAYDSNSIGFYHQGSTPLRGKRLQGQHQFLTIEYSREFLSRHLAHYQTALHPLIARVVSTRTSKSGMSLPSPMRMEHREVIKTLREPSVNPEAQPLWFECKAMELAASLFFDAHSDEELFCDRQKRLARDRCESVISVLQADLASPPELEELGRKVGCSQYYLSRTFSKEMGLTIAQYLKKLRLEKAAELLRSGRFNVTQVAHEVGYSSLSHFSQTFHQTFGCCPGLYGVAPNHAIAKRFN